MVGFFPGGFYPVTVKRVCFTTQETGFALNDRSQKVMNIKKYSSLV